MKNSAQRLGERGEQAAAEYLMERGYRILDRNWRCARGELDLVVLGEADVVIAVEVKTRSSQRYGTGFDAVNAGKYRRLQQLLLLWGAEHHQFVREVRIDVVEVWPTAAGLVCEHHQRVDS